MARQAEDLLFPGVWKEIFQKLSWRDKLNVRGTCRAFNDVLVGREAWKDMPTNRKQKMARKAVKSKKITELKNFIDRFAIEKEDINISCIIWDMVEEKTKEVPEEINWLIERFNMKQTPIEWWHEYLMLQAVHSSSKKAEWIVTNFIPTKEDRKGHTRLLQTVALLKHYELLKLIVNKFKITDKEMRTEGGVIFRIACIRYESLDEIKWLITHFHLTAEEIKEYKLASKVRVEGALSWMLEKCHPVTLP